MSSNIDNVRCINDIVRTIWKHIECNESGRGLKNGEWGYQQNSSVDNATLNRFFSLHYLLPFILVGLVVLHLIALHHHGSNNPLGVSANGDRVPFHPNNRDISK